ncbi:M28 family metallopeptidase [Halosolutus gelatinilyticus]|uniref:M28 family metallopeptidase n=1 Tax=Halosolutus gelatinilyticus TaxID=2931975 RepID=UPI001FF3BAA5|nr:M28 family metallopeptidase [Halosolutus gelatinilyticus]
MDDRGSLVSIERALGRAWTDDRPWNLLTRLTELPHRMGGSPFERQAAELVRDALVDAGVANVRFEEFPMQYWERGTAEFAVLSDVSAVDADSAGTASGGVDRSFEAIALPYSPAGDVEGPLVDVGYGTPEEIDETSVKGAIAVANTTTPPEKRFVHRMEKFGHAVAAGAKAFIFGNHVPGQLPPTGALRFDAEAAIPGVGVSAETYDWLTDYADRGARARLRVDADTREGSSQNVIGTIGADRTRSAGASDEGDADAADEGTDASGGDGEILVVAHYDGHDISEAALDNGCGVATVVGAARILAAIEDDLARPVRIAAVGCEELGLMGAEALADDLDLDSIGAVVNVDGAGRFRNLRALSHGSEFLADLADRVADEAGQPLGRDPDPHPFSDHWPSLRAGVPALQLHSEPPAGRERGRGWGHTGADTRDKVDPRNLREHAILTALLVRGLSTADVPPIDEVDLRERLREQDYEPGMRAAGIWPPAWDDE